MTTMVAPVSAGIASGSPVMPIIMVIDNAIEAERGGDDLLHVRHFPPRQADQFRHTRHAFLRHRRTCGLQRCVSTTALATPTLATARAGVSLILSEM
ncbi:hypothetical protein [Falsiroseomonas sp. E2-1-a4]|uniref:hypothetical protein n=1 Tax=Falsiroseomonas sp. E2-1-a4 TaxID=3239299 RepID=UPI003F30C387